MKFQILEEELVKLAAEREEIEKKKAFYERVEEFQARSYAALPDQQVGELFFRGVATQQSLKKRYKDLIKIYHPDNVDGDNSLVIEINKEYDQAWPHKRAVSCNQAHTPLPPMGRLGI